MLPIDQRAAAEVARKNRTPRQQLVFVQKVNTFSLYWTLQNGSSTQSTFFAEGLTFNVGQRFMALASCSRTFAPSRSSSILSAGFGQIQTNSEPGRMAPRCLNGHSGLLSLFPLQARLPQVKKSPVSGDFARHPMTFRFVSELIKPNLRLLRSVRRPILRSAVIFSS